LSTVHKVLIIPAYDLHMPMDLGEKSCKLRAGSIQLWGESNVRLLWI